MGAINKAREWLAKKLTPEAPAAKRGKRMYQGADFSRLTSAWASLGSSGDAEVRVSLRTLRNRCRQLARDNDYAKNALRAITNNVVGKGVTFHAQVMMLRGGKLDERRNEQVENAFAKWARMDSCDVAGKFSFPRMQRVAMRSVVESGEVLLRKVKRPFGRSKVPYALQLIESDQLAEIESGRAQSGNQVRMGVEVDKYGRPVAYHIYKQHPGDYQFTSGASTDNQIEIVPADEIIHLYLPDELRPGSTRGVPWMHSAMTRLNHMGGYEESEVVAARASASIMGFIQSPELYDPSAPGAGALGADDVMAGSRVYDMEPGLLKELAPGETFTGFAPTRPNGAMDPFMRLMLRGAAAGIGVSYETLSKDYSQSNYSSSRLALLDDRDYYRVLQQWFGEAFLQVVLEDWLAQAALVGEIPQDYFANPDRYTEVVWKYRGWDWVDPWKEVQASRTAIRSGLKSIQGVLADSGEDFRDIFLQRRREIDLAAELDLVMDTDPAQVNDKGIVQPVDPIEETETGDVTQGGEVPDQVGDSAGQDAPKQDSPPAAGE
jgi:lambda family phage portal protein